jgi:hypothetical protein
MYCPGLTCGEGTDLRCNGFVLCMYCPRTLPCGEGTDPICKGFGWCMYWPWTLPAEKVLPPEVGVLDGVRWNKLESRSPEISVNVEVVRRIFLHLEKKIYNQGWGVTKLLPCLTQCRSRVETRLGLRRHFPFPPDLLLYEYLQYS